MYLLSFLGHVTLFKLFSSTRAFETRTASGSELFSHITLSSHNHIYIAKYLSFTTDDQFKNVGDTTVLARESAVFRLPPASKKRACLSSLLFSKHRAATRTSST